MAGFFPQRLVEHLRRVHLFIGAGKPAAHIGDERLEHAPALAVPEDDARPFDPLTARVPDVNAPADERPIGGLGIHLVRTIMDRVAYALVLDATLPVEANDTLRNP